MGHANSEGCLLKAGVSNKKDTGKITQRFLTTRPAGMEINIILYLFFWYSYPTLLMLFYNTYGTLSGVQILHDLIVLNLSDLSKALLVAKETCLSLQLL